MTRLSAKQVEALRAVEAGRVRWGAAQPQLARRQGRLDNPEFIVDGFQVYGREHGTYESLAERELIVARVDLLPTKVIPEHTREYKTGAGTRQTQIVPERTVPEDDGWRAEVQLTEEGRAALAGIRPAPRQS